MTVSFQPSDLLAAAKSLDPSAQAFASWTVTPPDPAMYGQLVGAAATDAEPAVTEDLNALLDATGVLLSSLGRRLQVTAQTYVGTEDAQLELVRGIGSGEDGS